MRSSVGLVFTTACFWPYNQGFMLVCEDMFRSVAFARDRWLCEGRETLGSGNLEVQQLSIAVFLLSN